MENDDWNENRKQSDFVVIFSIIEIPPSEDFSMARSPSFQFRCIFLPLKLLNPHVYQRLSRMTATMMMEAPEMFILFFFAEFKWNKRAHEI